MTTTDIDLDGILSAWLREGGERAPEHDVALAMARVASTKQQRSWRPRWSGASGARRTARARLAFVALVAILIAATAMVLVVGSTAVRRANPPVEVPPPTSDAVADLVPYRDFGSSVWMSLPHGWRDVNPAVTSYRHFSGKAPEGHLSASNDSLYRVTVCGPTCDEINLPPMIPYSADQQISALRAGVERIAGTDRWAALPSGLIPEIEQGQWLDATSTSGERAWRHRYVIGMRDRAPVAIAWSQPSDVFDEGLLEAVLESMFFMSRSVHSDSDLTRWRADDFTILIPGVWTAVDHPTFGDAELGDVYRFAGGRVLVALGSVDGSLRWCDPVCNDLGRLASLDAIERAIRATVPLGTARDATLGGEVARAFDSAEGADRRYVIAMHRGRAAIVMVDVGEWQVADGIVDQMLDSFAFMIGGTADAVDLPDHTLSTAGGRVEFRLPGGFGAQDETGVIRFGAQVMTVTVGGRDGSIVTCTKPAAPWEQCRAVTATTLDALAAAVQPTGADDHGVHAPITTRQAVTLDGEPGFFLPIHAYEYPARGGQEVVYFGAIHRGRPYLVRIWTSSNEASGLAAILAGFRFVD